MQCATTSRATLTGLVRNLRFSVQCLVQALSCAVFFHAALSSGVRTKCDLVFVFIYVDYRSSYKAIRIVRVLFSELLPI